MRTVRRRLRTVAVVAAVLGFAALVGSVPASAASTGPFGSTPFTDPNAKGFLALCDSQNEPVTSGNVNAAPFAWKAISSLLPSAIYQGPGRNVELTVYVPNKQLTPQYWPGDQLTGTSYYNDPAYPTAQATYADISLAAIIKELPPTWNGMYQLRMIFANSQHEGEDVTPYPATTIQVTGNTWHVLQGGSLPCGQATAKAAEAMLGDGLTPSPGVPTPGPSATGSTSGKGGSSPSSASAGSSGSGASPSGGAGHSALAGGAGVGTGSTATGTTTAAGSSGHSSSSAAVPIGIGVGVVVLAGAGGVWYWRRRQAVG